MDMTIPASLGKEAVVIGGKVMDTTYNEFQHEADLINKAFCEVMIEGDAKGRIFSFPIPTYNVTKDCPKYVLQVKAGQSGAQETGRRAFRS
jgi:ribonucleoside-triphosphate reductase